MNLDNLSRRGIKPALQVAGLPWRDAYRTNRRSVGTITTALAGDNGLVRQGSAASWTTGTTQGNYTQVVPAETAAAMAKLEAEFAQCDANVMQAMEGGLVN